MKWALDVARGGGAFAEDLVEAVPSSGATQP